MSAGRGSEEDQEHGARAEEPGGETWTWSTDGVTVPQRDRGWKTQLKVERAVKTEGKRSLTGTGRAGEGQSWWPKVARNPIPTPTRLLPLPPLSCQHIRFPQMPLPDTCPSSSPSPYPWTQAIHPNTGWKKKQKPLKLFSASPAPDPFWRGLLEG